MSVRTNSQDPPTKELPPVIATVTRGWAFACPIPLESPITGEETTCGFYHTTPHNPLGEDGEGAWYYEWCQGCEHNLYIIAVGVKAHQQDHQWQWQVRIAPPGLM